MSDTRALAAAHQLLGEEYPTTQSLLNHAAMICKDYFSQNYLNGLVIDWVKRILIKLYKNTYLFSIIFNQIKYNNYALSIFSLYLPAAARIDHLWTIKWQGAHLRNQGFSISAPKPADVDQFIRFIHEDLAPRKVNTLLLRVDYNYQYTSHPELRDSIALSSADVNALVTACRQHQIRIILKSICWVINPGTPNFRNSWRYILSLTRLHR